MFNNLRGHVERIAAERPVLLAFMVVVAAAFIVVPISIPFYQKSAPDFWGNIVAEAHGVLFDLIIIGWFLFWVNRVGERRIRFTRYREEIEDYLGWNSPEATLRIVGNIRRLNRGGITSGFRLTEAHLEGAKLGGAEMAGTDLWGAHLERAGLRETNLNGSNIAGAVLDGADLAHALLRKVDLRGASMNEADLERVDLIEADLRGASLLSADLQYAVLHGVDLRRARLGGANLRGANLDRANLEGANLEHASLRGASLRGATFAETDLTGADLLGANLTGARLPSSEEALIALFKPAKSLFGAEFDPAVQERLRAVLPHRFQMASSSASNGEHNGAASRLRGTKAMESASPDRPVATIKSGNTDRPVGTRKS